MNLDDINLDDLHVFLQVADSGGFTAAGRVLDRSTKQVSRQVQRLERALGIQLLHRTTRSVSITEGGRTFYVRAERILQEVQGVRQDLAGEPGSLSGRLRVAVPSLATVAGLSGWAERLRSAHPDIRLQVLVSDHPLDLAADGIDVQLVGTPPTQTTFLLRKLTTLRASLAAHSSYLDQHPAPEVPEQLADHECLLFVSDQIHSTWTLEDPNGRSVSVQVTGAFQSTGSDVLLSAMHQGLGIGVCGPHYLERLGEARGLVPILPGWRFEEFAIYAVMPRASRKSPLVEAFLDEAVRGLKAWF